MPLARISITVPPELVSAADRRARELDRSRSWVVAEAMRLYLESDEPGAGGGRGAGGAGGGGRGSRRDDVRETVLAGYAAPGLGDHRRAQLEADMALTPEQRVREAERTASQLKLRHPRWRGDRVLMFDRYEDYLAWEKWADLTPR